MRRRRKIGLGIVGICLVAVVVALWPRMPRAASDALATADQYELLSLDPGRPVAPSPDLYHGYRVLGQTEVADAATRERLNRALRGGVESVLANRPHCFNPRHGIRVTRAGQTMEFLICFECEQVQVWNGSQRVANWSTDSSPQPVFDDALRQANVPLPKPG